MAVDFHKDSKLLASSSVDDSVIVWNIEAQIEMANLDRAGTDENVLSELEALTQRGKDWIQDFAQYSSWQED